MCQDNDTHYPLPGGQYAIGWVGLSLFIALRWMQRPERVMVGLAENIQACLRIFWQPQHQWLARDILHLPQGVYSVFVLWPAFTGLIRPIRGRIEIHRTGFLRFLSYDQPRTGHKSVPSVAEQLSIERVFNFCFVRFFYFAPYSKDGHLTANKRQ